MSGEEIRRRMKVGDIVTISWESVRLTNGRPGNGRHKVTGFQYCGKCNETKYCDSKISFNNQSAECFGYNAGFPFIKIESDLMLDPEKFLI
jgi:hypothetical protein